MAYRSVIVGSVVVVFAAGRAAAQSTPFATLDRADADSIAGVQVAFISPGRNLVTQLGVNGTLLHFDGHARYIDAPSGFGGYVQLPFTVLTQGGGSSNATTATGDFELGGIYIPRHAWSEIRVVLRAGVTIPTGTNGFGSQLGGFGTVRIADIYQSLPRGTSLRLAASPVYRSGGFFARADVGLDLNIDQDAMDFEAGRSADTLARFDIGAGGDFGWLAVTGELASVISIGSGQFYTSFGQRVYATMAFTARLSTAGFHPYLALVVPAGNNMRATLDRALMLGIDATLP